MRRVLRSLYAVDALVADEVLQGARIEPAARPETLTPAQFALVLRAFDQRRQEDARIRTLTP